MKKLLQFSVTKSRVVVRDARGEIVGTVRRDLKITECAEEHLTAIDTFMRSLEVK